MQGRSVGRPPTNAAKHCQIESNMDEIARLMNENRRLELEIAEERMRSKVAHIGDAREARRLRSELRQVAQPVWATA